MLLDECTASDEIIGSNHGAIVWDLGHDASVAEKIDKPIDVGRKRVAGQTSSS